MNYIKSHKIATSLVAGCPLDKVYSWGISNKIAGTKKVFIKSYTQIFIRIE